MMLEELEEYMRKPGTFYKMPKKLFHDPEYADMSCDAKALYMILLDRRYLSESNGSEWRDEQGCVFLYFTIKEMMGLMNYGNKKINEILKELEKYKLIFRKHRGLGKPNRLYVYDVFRPDDHNWYPQDKLTWKIVHVS